MPEWLSLAIAVAGIALSVAAGASQGLTAEQGVFLRDYAYLVQAIPEREFAIGLIKGVAAICIRAIVGGHGVVLLLTSVAAWRLTRIAACLEGQPPAQEGD